jgi:hypothetical protein
LRDETSGEPIPGEEYRITLPDGTDVRGYLDDKGCAGVSGIKSPGGCKITFPAIDKNCWRPA